MKQFVKILLLFLWLMTSIITGACALNSAIPFYMVFGALNILINIGAIYKIAKELELF